MEFALKVLILFILLSAFGVSDGNSLRVVGHAEEDFETDLSYITRFVYAPDVKGRLQYSVKIPANDCCSDLTLFNGREGQWPLIQSHGHEMTCFEKLATIPGVQASVYPLMESSSVHICEYETDPTGEKKLHCHSDRRFQHPQPQWYYYTFMNCHYRSHSGINATYDLHMTNGHEGFLIEFSADEDTNLPVTFICDVILLACIISGFVFGVILYSRKMLHPTYKIWFLSLIMHFTGCVIMTIAWYQFALDGFERNKAVSVGHNFTSAGSVVFAILMIFISKGFTITRLTIRSVGKVKIFAFACWFSFCYMILYIILEKSDRRDIKNIYDTPAALGIVGMRIGACIWCLYGAFFTFKDFPQKRYFYIIFATLSSFWFLAEPVMILFSNYWLPLYCRAKWVHAIYLFTHVIGHVVFVLVTRPSATNTFFPFHLSTNKVGVAEDDEESCNSNKYIPTEATFANFLAVSEMPEVRESLPHRNSKRTSSIHSSGNQPSKGRFDVFMTTSERAKVQQKEEEGHSLVPTISASISMTTMINCPVPPPKNLPITYMMKGDSSTPVQGIRNMNQQIQEIKSDSTSTDSFDKEDDRPKLVMENLDGSKESHSDQKVNSSKVIKCPVEPPKNLPVTYHQNKCIASVPAETKTALSGKYGMYALADSDASASSSEDECHEAKPNCKIPFTFKNIKLEQPKKADNLAKPEKSSEKKVNAFCLDDIMKTRADVTKDQQVVKPQQEQPLNTPKQVKEISAEPKYEVVPPSTKGRVIYVKPAKTTAIQLKAPRKESTQDKIPSADACSMYVSEATHISAPDIKIPSDEHNISYHITNHTIHSGRSRERVGKSASGRREADKRHSSSVDRRRPKEQVINPTEAQTSKTSFRAATDLRPADDQSRPKKQQQKKAVEGVMKVEDLEETSLPSTSKNKTFSDAMHKNTAEVMEVIDLEEINLPTTSTDHQRSTASMKHSSLFQNDKSQSNMKTVEETETASSNRMGRGQRREGQESRRTKHREISTADRRRPSIMVMYSSDSGAQTFQGETPSEGETAIGPRTSSRRSANLATCEEEEEQCVSSKQRECYAGAAEGEKKCDSQKHGKQLCGPSASENHPETAPCTHLSVSQKLGKQFCGPVASESQPKPAPCAQLSVRRKSRKIQSSDLTVEEVIEQVPESQRRLKHRKSSVTNGMAVNKQELETVSQKQGKQCGPNASENNRSDSAESAQPAVRRKKTRKTQRSNLTIEDVIEQVPESQRRRKHRVASQMKKELLRADEPSARSLQTSGEHGVGAPSRCMVDDEQDQQTLEEAKTMDERRKRIRKMRAALEKEEFEYRKKLSCANTLESAVDKESKKYKRRQEVHAARKMLRTNNGFEQA